MLRTASLLLRRTFFRRPKEKNIKVTGGNQVFHQNRDTSVSTQLLPTDREHQRETRLCGSLWTAYCQDARAGGFFPAINLLKGTPVSWYRNQTTNQHHPEIHLSVQPSFLSPPLAKLLHGLDGHLPLGARQPEAFPL